jgi:hypothetical protein
MLALRLVIDTNVLGFERLAWSIRADRRPLRPEM